MPRRPPIRNLDDFIEEAKMLPDGYEPTFAVTNPLEAHFMGIADKHGVLDNILDRYSNGCYEDDEFNDWE